MQIIAYFVSIINANLKRQNAQYFAHFYFILFYNTMYYIYATFCAMDDLGIIAVIIRKRRIALQLTQYDLSEMSGVALRTVNALETGKSSVNLKNLLAINDV